jgi:hypothetical protein
MATHRTNDEVLQEHKAKMGAALGAEFNRLWNECAGLRLKWQDYFALFRHEQRPRGSPQSGGKRLLLHRS